MNVWYEEVNSELAKHRNVELNIDWIGIDISGDSGWNHELTRSKDSSRSLFGNSDDVWGVMNAHARDKPNVCGEVVGECFRISSRERSSVLKIEVYQVLRNLSTFLLVCR